MLSTKSEMHAGSLVGEMCNQIWDSGDRSQFSAK